MTASDTINSQRDSMETLLCSALGGPANTFSWRDSSGTLIGSMEEVSVSVSDATDGGNYTCTVTNAAGNGIATTIINGMCN